MKVGRVIGSVVLCHTHPSLQGARWLIVAPCGRDELANTGEVRVTPDAGLVVYDTLGASTGDLIGYTEGGEACVAFSQPTPVDAYNSAILDHINFSPAE